MPSCRSSWRLNVLCVLVVGGALRAWSSPSAAEVPSGLGQSVAHVSPGGLAVYRPERWGHVTIYLRNPTDDPLELLTTTFFENEPTLQYGRRVWLPPKSKLQVWQPLRLPRTADGPNLLNIRTLVMEADKSREVLLRSDIGFRQLDGTVRTMDDAVTGLVEPPILSPTEGTLFPDEDVDAVSQLVTTSRLEAQQTRRIADLLEQFLPASEEAYQALDHLVIADSRLAEDAAGLAAIRRWLFGGGRLWVMLDRVDPRILERILGDEFACEVVDRVGLTTVRLTDPQDDTRVLSTQDHERPIEFVRAAISNVEVAYNVDGWPAAFWKSCGEGRLLVTTLGARGWVRPRTSADSLGIPTSRRPQSLPSPAMPNLASDELRSPTRFSVLEPMSILALDFFSARLPNLLPLTVLEPLTQEYVGYEVPKRATVLGLLMGFTVLLLVLGIWLWRRSRLEWLGVIGPGIALAISLILVMLGRQQRNLVPPTVASLQFVQPNSGTEDVRISGTAGLFAPDAGAATIRARQGGWMFPDASGFESTTRRLVWTDLDRWQWENLPETAGVRSAAFQASTETSQRLEAHATFGPDGLIGHLKLPSDRRPTDPVLATRTGRFGVELHSDGTFAAKADAVLASEQFLAAGLLSDEQDRRRRLLQQLLANPLRLDFPATPHLFCWTEPWDAGFEFGENRRSLGAALLAVPLQLHRPASGTRMRIASPFLPYRGAIGPDGSHPTGWWDVLHQQWIEKFQPAETWLRFQLPTELLPITVERGRLTVLVKGPIGKLTLAAYRPKTQSVVPLKTWIDPVGTLTWEITDPEMLSVSADGGLMLRVSGGDPDRPELTKPDNSEDSAFSFWQIESLTLELTTQAIDSTVVSAAQP